MQTVNNFLIKDKNVALRVDLNVPTSKNGKVTDDKKILDIKLTLDKLRSNNNKIFLISHFGRPNGKFNKKYSLEFLKDILAKKLLINKIFFVNSCENQMIDQQKKIMKKGDVCLLENIRFYQDEEKNDLNFSKKFAKNFDIYVNEAFSASHRKHSSIVGITKYLPSLAGINLINEIENLNNLILNPKKPSTIIIGGSKISTKLKLLKNIIEVFDNIVIGGAMANTFLLSQGLKLGKSLVENNLIGEASNILEKSKNYNTNVILPIDLVCSNNLEDKKNIKIVDIKNVLPNQIALDIGDKSINLIKSVILKSNMVLWNGPLGAYEHEPFDHATNEIAKIIKIDATKLKIPSFAGGGDTIAAIKKAKAEKYFTYISTAGGAFLEWLEGKESPGVIALRENNFF
tara:strand:- start:5484 stop:6686 length:1203 start_codon:yes stop_codon:yes gene_type:complete